MKKIILNLSFNLFFLFFFITGTYAQSIPKWKLKDLQSAIAKTDKPTIFNFWATFCKPCIEEIPYFEELVKKYDSAGVQLILVSLDLSETYPKKIQSFANKFKFKSPIKFLDETNADLFCPAVDSSWSGAIPASLFINNKTNYRKFFEDQLSREKLEREIRAMILVRRETSNVKL
ncbi:MAG: TlpA family protein disulfide reductase [Flavisolibacter sp.]